VPKWQAEGKLADIFTQQALVELARDEAAQEEAAGTEGAERLSRASPGVWHTWVPRIPGYAVFKVSGVPSGNVCGFYRLDTVDIDAKRRCVGGEEREVGACRQAGRLAGRQAGRQAGRHCTGLCCLFLAVASAPELTNPAPHCLPSAPHCSAWTEEVLGPTRLRAVKELVTVALGSGKLPCVFGAADVRVLAVREDVEALRDVASTTTFNNALTSMPGIGAHMVTGGVSTRQVNAYYDKRADKAVREDLIRWAGLGGCRGRAAPLAGMGGRIWGGASPACLGCSWRHSAAQLPPQSKGRHLRLRSLQPGIISFPTTAPARFPCPCPCPTRRPAGSLRRRRDRDAGRQQCRSWRGPARRRGCCPWCSLCEHSV
jgi:hypothetical protein